MAYAFEGRTEQQRAQSLHKLYTKCVSAAAIYGKVLLTPDNLGALIWLPGKNFTVTVPMEIRSGMALLPLQIGIRPSLRLMKHEGESEGWIRKNCNDDMGYIWSIGVMPQARGRGYSRLLINESLNQMREARLTECWLKTEDPKNVLIYQKLGFTLMNTMKVKSSGITAWALKRLTA
jgi:ribosomal protein S18 acetylase RimI-like enzyme